MKIALLLKHSEWHGSALFHFVLASFIYFSRCVPIYASAFVVCCFSFVPEFSLSLALCHPLSLSLPASPVSLWLSLDPSSARKDPICFSVNGVVIANAYNH